MTALAPQGSLDVLTDYRHEVAADFGPQAHDELLTPTGVHAGGQGVADTIEALGRVGLLTRSREARRFVAEDRITYGTADATGLATPWSVDPLPLIIEAQEWSRLVPGLAQRSHVLDLLLTDLYGERRLLRDRVLPPEIVLGHPGFVRQVDGITLPGQRQLLINATDLGRGADGQWAVLADRAQAPSGAGYAMATRRIITRVMAGLHRTTELARLRGFFHTMATALQAVAPNPHGTPRVVLLSPGGGSETAFDQAFMATLLGFPLVESDDLTMRDGRVWLRTTGRLEPVDVVLRRVDPEFVDPLELRSDSQLGLPGLIEATRLGTVSVVNPIGSAVLENPAIQHFLDDISRALTGEALALPGVSTYWCGESSQRQHVLSRLDQLIVKPIWRGNTPTSYFGPRLSADQRDDLARRIEAEPWQWTAQDILPMSTAPVVTEDGLEPRRVVLRTFGVAADGDYHIMPGGLGRAASDIGQWQVSNFAGAHAKDVWVLAPSAAVETLPAGLAPVRPDAEWTPRPPAPAALAPRVAGDLYWMGRYAERTEFTARLLRVASDLAEDHASRPQTPGGVAMTALLQAVTEVTMVRPGFTGDGAEQRLAQPLETLRELTFDRTTPGTVAFAADRVIACAGEVRDQLSLDTWLVLSRLERTLASRTPDDEQLQPTLAQVQESLLALAGIMAQSMIRDATWAYIDAGSRIERAQLTLSLVRRALTIERSPVIDGQVTENVLTVGESVITHRRRTAAGMGPSAPSASAVDLLLLDNANPRSVKYQLLRLAESLRLVDDTETASHVGELAALLREVDAEELAGGHDRAQLDDLLARLSTALRDIADEIDAAHFTRKAPQRTVQMDWSSRQEQRQEQRQ